MNWHDVKGWTDFDNIYQEQVNKAENRAVFVEIGTAYGKSAIMMAEKIRESGKDIKFITIDPFTGSPDEIGAYDKDMYYQFLANLRETGFQDYVSSVKLTSEQASKMFDKESIDFCFVDGLHTYLGVMEDLQNYWPLIKKGGTFAGHDYTSAPPVKKAVDRFFAAKRKKVHQNGSSWIVYK